MALVKQNISYALEINTGYTNESDIIGLGLDTGNIRFITGQTDLVSSGSTFYDGFLVKKGMTNPSRQIDISKTGDYGDLSDFSFKVNNSIKYWSLLTSAGNPNLTQNINLINKPVNVYAVIDNVFYQIWTGVVSDLSRNEKEFIINCQDASISLHKDLPRNIINDKIVPVTFGDNEYVKLINVTSGDNQEILLNDKNITTIYEIVGETIYPSLRYKIETSIFSDEFDVDKFKDKYIRMICGGTRDNYISDELLIKIQYSSASNLEGFQQVTKLGSFYLFKGNIDPTYIKWNIPDPIYALGRYTLEGLPINYFNRHGSNEQNAYCQVIDPFNSFVYNTSSTNLIDNLVYKYNSDTNNFDKIPAEVINNNDGYIKIVSPNLTTEGTSEYYSPLDFTLNAINLKVNPYNTWYGMLSGYGTSSYNPAVWKNYLTLSGNDLSAILDSDQTTYKEIICSGGMVGTDPIGADLFFEFDYTINSEIYSLDEIYAMPDISIVTPSTSGENWISFVNFPCDLNENPISFVDPDTTIGCSYPFKDSGYQREISASELEISGTNTPLLISFNIPQELYDTVYLNNQNTFIPELVCNMKRYDFNLNEMGYDWAASSADAYIKDKCMINDTSIQYFNNKICKRFKLIVRCHQTYPNTVNVRFHGFSVFYSNTASFDDDIWIKANGISGTLATDSVYGIFKYILENNDGIPTSAIDYGNLSTTRGISNVWEAGRQITDRQNSKKYLSELCQQSYVALFPDRFGKRKFNTYLTSSSPVATFDENTIIRDSIKTFKASPIKDVYNEFIVNYDYNPATGKPNKYINITKTDLNTFPAISGDWTSYVTGIDVYNTAKTLWENAQKGFILTHTYVTNPTNLQELKWYHDNYGSSYRYLDNLITWTAVQHYNIQLAIPLTSANIERELTDKISFNDILLTNNTDYNGYITKIEYDLNNDFINIELIADQENYNPVEEIEIIENGSRDIEITENGSRDIEYLEG